MEYGPVKPASAKAKGRRLQQMVRDMLTLALRLEPGDVESRSMGAGGTDLLLSPAARRLFPYAVECKNTERPNLKDAWDQACQHVGRKGNEDLWPLVVMSWNRNPEPVAIIPLRRLLALEAASRGLATVCRGDNHPEDDQLAALRQLAEEGK